MTKKNLKISLYAVDYPLAGYLLELIRAAFWLSNLNNDEKYSKVQVNVILLKAPINFSANNLFKKFLTYVVGFLGNRINSYFLSKIIIMTNRDLGVITNKILFIIKNIFETAIIEKVYNKKSLYEGVKRGKETSIQYKNLEIKFLKQKYSFLLSSKLIFESFFSAVKLYKDCFEKNTFLPQKFLLMKHNNLHIGDLVASYTVRIYPKTGGQFKSHIGLFINLVNGIYINNLANLTKINVNEENYICPSEPFYTHHIWLRNFKKKNIQVLETHNPTKKFKIYNSSNHINQWIAEKPSTKIFDYDAASEYLKKRVHSPSEIIDSFSNKNFTNNNFEKEVYDDDGLKVNLENDALNIVLFLHDFSDALYADGLDGFNDLYDWTTYSLNKLIENNNIGKIFIKSHPSADFIASRANKIALFKIREFYKKNKKIIFLDKNASLVAICKNNKIFGITHHGNIALELTYLNQPAIGWINGPWGPHYQFLKTWREKDDYGNLLSGLKYSDWKPPNLKVKEILYMYIYNFELKRMSSEDKSIRVYLTNHLRKISEFNYKEFEKYMRGIEIKDSFFNEILDKVYEKSLND